jgi:hypothetical protein
LRRRRRRRGRKRTTMGGSSVVGESASITVLSFYEKKWVKSDNG